MRNPSLALVALLAAGGCGLIDSDIADFALRLPEREVTVDTADFMLAAVDQMPAIDCTAEPTICPDAVMEVCSAEGCAGACGGETCELGLSIVLWNRFDLAAESPELQQIDGQPLVSVKIQRVWFEVIENSLDVDSPELEVAVAPQTVMTLAEGEVIGTIPPVPAMTLVADGEVQLTAEGAQILSDYMKSYSTPFNLIVGSTITLAAGDRIPTGRLVAIVHVDASAGL